MSWYSKSRMFDTLEMIAGGLSSAAAIIGLSSFLWTTGGMWPMIFGGAALAFLISMGFIKLRKAWVLNDRRLDIFGKRVHSVTHAIRDAYSELQLWSTTPELDQKGLFHHARRTAQDCVDDLAEIISESSGQTVVATLQYFRRVGNGADWGAADLKSIQVDTLARSKNCANADARVNSVALVDNYAYREIVEKGRHQFAAPNLEKHCEDYSRLHGEPFSLGNQRRTDAYRAVVVLPIRVSGKFCMLGAKQDNYFIIGFISLDSMSIDAFREDHLTAYCNFGKACADAMFHYLRLVDELNERLTHGTPPLFVARGLRAMEGEA